jgi:enoyl-CoA hydratase/carnithine racemase
VSAAKPGVRRERSDGVVTITLDDGSGENRLSPEVLEELARIVEELRDDETSQAVIITGTGREFFSMGILNPAIRAQFTKDQIVALVRRANRLYDAIEALPQIVIAALNGEARAGAGELTLACDIRLVADHAVFRLPEALWGGFPGAAGPIRLPRLVGRARALELICTGRPVPAAEMKEIGLALAVHPAATLLDEARMLARRIAASGPLATRGSKRIMNVHDAAGFVAARALSDALRHALEWSADVDEGIAAHRDGRTPRFTGR